jgi:hypothetical protein
MEEAKEKKKNPSDPKSGRQPIRTVCDSLILPWVAAPCMLTHVVSFSGTVERTDRWAGGTIKQFIIDFVARTEGYREKSVFPTTYSIT